MNIIGCNPRKFPDGLTVTKVVFESIMFVAIDIVSKRLTVTKVVFEFKLSHAAFILFHD